jgi:hydrogenase/urease accessory protein HupE
MRGAATRERLATTAGRLAPRVVALLALAVVLLVAASARAHEIGLSRGEYRLTGNTLTAELTFSRREMAAVVAELDADRDGHVTPSELTAAEAAVGRAVLGGLRVGEGTCNPRLDQARLIEEDGLVIAASYTCERVSGSLPVELLLLEDLAFGHRHVARVVTPERSEDHVLHRRSRSFAIPIDAAAVAAATRDTRSIAWEFLVSGVEHIAFGLDHLAFLFGLVLLGGRVRSILLMVTAFTVAHSITLALAVLGIWAPSPDFVEPAIALSVAYVGIENLVAKDAEKRWRITFPFGLVHGFGFAGALGQIDLPHAQVPIALVTFNLGVEAGQLALLAVVLPLVLFARQREWFRDTGVKALSCAVALAGVIWFVTRVAGVLAS